MTVKTNLLTENIAKIENVKSTKVGKNSYIWRQVYTDEKGNQIVVNSDMTTMSEEHLQKAFHKCQKRVHALFTEMSGWEDLSCKLEEVAKQKGITLKDANYPIFKKNRILNGKNKNNHLSKV